MHIYVYETAGKELSRTAAHEECDAYLDPEDAALAWLVEFNSEERPADRYSPIEYGWLQTSVNSACSQQGLPKPYFLLCTRSDTVVVDGSEMARYVLTIFADFELPQSIQDIIVDSMQDKIV